MSDAVVLMAYGSPATAEDIRPYFEDIRGGRPVSDEAVAGLAQRYRRIGGRSPLDDVTEAQRAALERELGVPVFVGMKHWRPRIAEAVESALTGGATRILGLVLAPHYSRLSVGEYRERLEAAVAGRAELELVESWHDHEPFLDVLADRVRGTDAWVVFTAHSLPARILEEGDPYQEQLFETARADEPPGRAANLVPGELGERDVLFDELREAGHVCRRGREDQYCRYHCGQAPKWSDGRRAARLPRRADKI